MAEQVGIDIVARLDRFAAEMAKLPDITGKEAKAMTAELNRSIKAAEAAAKRASAAGKNAKDSFDRLGDAAGKSGQSAAKLAGALDLVAPGAGGAARAVNDLADVAEVAAVAGKGLGVSLVSVAAAGVALAGVAYLVSRAIRESGERAEQTKRAFDGLKDAQRAASTEATDLLQATERYTDRARVADGAITDLQARHRGEQADLARTAREAGKTAAAELRLAEETVRLTEGADEGNAKWREANAALLDARKRVDDVSDSYQAATVALDKAQAAETAAVRRAKAMEQAERRLAEARADADRQRTAHGASLAEERVAMQANAIALDDLVARINDLNATEEERARADADRMLQELDARALTAGSAQDYAEQRVEIELWLQGRLAEIRKSEQESAKAEADRQKREAERARDEMLAPLQATAASTQQLTGIIGDAFGTMYDRRMEQIAQLQEYEAEAGEFLTDAQRRQLQVRIKAQRDAARREFEVQKLAALSEVAVNTASAVVQALPNIPLSVLIGGLGAIQAGTIAKQQPAFYTGAAPDELTAAVHNGEAILAPRAADALGDEKINDLNAGVGIRAEPSVVFVQQYRHQVLDVVMAEALGAGGRFSSRVRGMARRRPAGWR